MFKETYKRTKLEITCFDAEDIIITSGEPPFTHDDYEDTSNNTPSVYVP